MRIEDYAMVGDTQTAGLVRRNGSIDWTCLPRFDSGACFAVLLGDEQHGHWQIAPLGHLAMSPPLPRNTLIVEKGRRGTRTAGRRLGKPTTAWGCR